MDDATKKMMVTIVGPILRKGLISLGSALATHGILASNQTETFVSVGMALVGIGWSFWNDYGRAIVLSQLEVLKAKSLAQAAKLQQHDIAPPDAAAVAAASAKSPDMATLSVEEVKKASASLPAAVAGTTAVLVLFVIALTLAGPALAQKQRKNVDLSAQRKGFIGTVIDKTAQDIAAQKAAQPAAQDGLIGGKIFQQLVKPLNDLQKFVGSDLNGGIKLSTLIPDLQDGHGQQCYIAMRSFTAIFKAHPLPATLQVVTDFEAFRLAAAAATRLCHDTHCIQLSVDTTNAIQRTVGPLAAGVTPPTLQSLCAYVPDVPLVPGLAEKDIPPDPGATIGAIIPGTGGQMMNPDGTMPTPVTPSPATPVTPQ